MSEGRSFLPSISDMDDSQEKSNSHEESEPKESMTPEEKLFKAISSGQPEPDLSPEENGRSQDLLETDLFTKVELWIDRFKAQLGVKAAELFKKFVPRPQGAGKKSDAAGSPRLAEIIQIKFVNQGFMAVVGALVLYLILDFTVFRTPRNQISGLDRGAVNFKALGGLQQRPDLSRYVQQLNKRNVFLPPAPLPPPATPQGGQGGQQPAKPTAPPPNIQLVGISWDDQEYVAMVEYDPDKGASFVRKGDVLGNGVKVEEITENTVTLTQGDQKWELK